jgi:hypothetical protein
MALVTVEEIKTALGIGSLYGDEFLQEICNTAIVLVEMEVEPEDFEAEPDAMRIATLTLAIEIFQAIKAPAGQSVAVDFTPSPFRLGKSLVWKVVGLLSPYRSTSGWVG